MAESVSIHVGVPATSANLGPAFDCLGLALDIWNEVHLTFGGQTERVVIQGEGADSLPRDRSNLILQAAARLAAESGSTWPTEIEMHCHNSIPISSGLGSSCAAVTAGLLAAKTFLNLDLSNELLLALAAEFEGHADNAAACLLGGLVIVTHQGKSWLAEKVLTPSLRAVIALPQVSLGTQQARAVLPKSSSYHDAIANIGCTALLVHALREGRFELLGQAMQDRLHQPYRLELIPGAQAALQAAYEAGASGAALSGAGPSLIALAEKGLEEIGAAMQKAFTSQGLPCRLYLTRSVQAGARVTREK